MIKAVDCLKTLKFIKGPGYLYDLFSLFVLYFNQDVFLSEQVNQNKAVEDTEHFNRVLNTIEKVPEELRIFFQLKENHNTFLTTHFFHKNVAQILLDSGINTIQTALKDVDEVVKNIIDFYFETLTIDVSIEDPQFIRTIGKRIRDSEYDVALKNSLYEFFLDPIPVIQTLCNELAKKDVLLSKIYNECDTGITKVQNNIDLHQLIKGTLQTKTNKLEVSTVNDFIISICVAHKNCNIVFASESKMLLLLGTDYEDFLNYMNTKDKFPELSQFGIALAEQNRIQILELIQKCGEMTVSDIKRELQLSHTNAYYHVTLLLKSKLLDFNSKGRSVYYSINHTYFKELCTILSKFSQEGGEKP